MAENSRCSILFHLLVPGGKWHTAISSPVSSASFCNSIFHSRSRRRATRPAIAYTKKKELIGPFKNVGRELRPKGEPEQVLVHDFLIPELGRVSPYGVYDLANNEAWVSVGIDHDTAAFAVESIRRWWWSMGHPLYPDATRLLVTADAGGSNGYRLRLWKIELQKLADETGLERLLSGQPRGWERREERF